MFNMMKIKYKSFAAILIACNVVILFNVVSSPRVMATSLMNQPSPECQLSTLDGHPIKSLRAMKGEVIYLDFWASWCPPCVQSFPFMNQLHRDFSQQGLRVIGVNLDEQIGDADAFLNRYDAAFTIAADPTKQCAKNFNVIAMPSTYLIDREGVVRYIHRGFRPGETEQLQMLVEQLLQH